MCARLVLILGGTGEAATLARTLDADPTWTPLTSLAGRTFAPAPIAGQTRSGGFGGVAGLSDWLDRHRPVAVIDATHPFARQMPHHAQIACGKIGIPRLRLLRPGWQQQPQDQWIRVEGAMEAVRVLPELGRTAFLSTGLQDLPIYLTLADRMALVVRSIEPIDFLPASVRAIRGRPPFTLDQELALIDRYGIEVLVTKDSGGPATAAKIEAAGLRRLPVVMLERPALPDGPLATDVDGALAWLNLQRA